MKATQIKSNFTIGGSEVAAVLGLSPWVSPHKIWATKTGRELLEPDNERFRAGRIAERYILELADITPQVEQLSLEVGAARGTIDAVIGKTVIELKTTVYLWDEIPHHYQLQMQWYMGLYHLWFGSKPKGLLIALDGQFNLRSYELPYDEALFATIDEKVGEWIEKYLLTDTPPPMNAAELGCIIPKPNRAKLPQEVADVVCQAKELRARISELEKQLKPMEESIKLAIGENEEAELPDGTVITWKGYTRQTLDTKAIQAEMPEIYQRYCKSSNYRVLKL